MLGSAAAAACMPAHDEALNDRSLMPPVSVTMQPRNLAPPTAAELVDVVAGLVVLDDEAELVLLPHAAMTSVADTANAAVAHALCFTLTSPGPARRSAWPRIRPGLSRRLCLVVSTGKGTRGYLACSLPNRNPIMMELLACRTDTRGFRQGYWCLPTRQAGLQAQRSLRGGAVGRSAVAIRRRHAREVKDDGQPATWCLGQPGRAAVRGDQAVHDGQAEPGAVRVGGGEPQEGALPVLGAHARAVVGHDDLRAGRGDCRGHGDVPA